MSIEVPVPELGDTLAHYPWGFLVTVRDDGRAQSVGVPTMWADGVLHAEVGHSTAANMCARPNVTLAFPGTSGEVYSLIVDGDATVSGNACVITPTRAVLHRAALGRT
ncbi:MAG: hypothetical protein KDB40_13335 [Acidimicrobiales bacterium]|nr:hypothetical protein [Acidimicrobiales bacterium]MCB9392514.1 pyridoxamine 5'-phosphate oxidase family protein [Acidimicrobiaceae bacterium]